MDTRDTERRTTRREAPAAARRAAPRDVAVTERDRRDLERMKRRIARCVLRQQRCTQAVLELGRIFLSVKRRRLWRIDGERRMSDWLKARFELDAPQASKYTRASRAIDPAEVEGYALSLDALAVLGRVPRAERRPLLLRIGGPLVTARQLRAALGPPGSHLQVRKEEPPALAPLARVVARQLRLVGDLEERVAREGLSAAAAALATIERQAEESLRRIQALRAAGPRPAVEAGILTGTGDGSAAAPAAYGPALAAAPAAYGPAPAAAADPALASAEPAQGDDDDPIAAELLALMDPSDPTPRPHRPAPLPVAPAVKPSPAGWLAGMGSYYDVLCAVPGAIEAIGAMEPGPGEPADAEGPERRGAAASPATAPTPTDDGVEYTPAPLPPAPLPCPLPADFYDASAPFPILRTAAIALGGAGFSDFGLLGLRYKSWEPLGLSYAGPFALGFFGVPGSGKSYAMGAVIEGALQHLRGVNNLRRPACVLALHYHPAASYEPELLAGVRPNGDPSEARVLTGVYNALPEGLRDVLVLTLPERVPEMRARHPHCQVHGIRFALRELGTDGLRTLLGLDLDHAPHYAQQVEGLLRQMDGPLSWNGLLRAIRAAPFDRTSRRLLVERLRRVRPWIDDRGCLRDFLRPGRLVQVDLRAEWLPRELAMTLFSLCLRVFALRPGAGSPDPSSGAADPPDAASRPPLLVAFDEAHKFTRSPEVRRLMETLVRERRHLGVSLVLASQDPVSVPADLLSLLDGVGVFRHESHAWGRHLGRACAAFRRLPVEATARLKPGLMWFWSRRWQVVDERWPAPEERPILVATRPRLSQHGGA